MNPNNLQINNLIVISPKRKQYQLEYDNIKAIFPQLTIKVLFSDFDGYILARRESSYNELLEVLEGSFV